MERSEAPRKESHHPTQARKQRPGIAGQLSRSEAFLYNGARCIDRLLDQWIDRPVRTAALTTAVLAVAFLIPH